jgi:hypothetical protein
VRGCRPPFIVPHMPNCNASVRAEAPERLRPFKRLNPISLSLFDSLKALERLRGPLAENPVPGRAKSHSLKGLRPGREDWHDS